MDLFSNRLTLQQFSAQGARHTYLGDHTSLCRVWGQRLMYVDTQDVSLAPHLLMGGCWEPWVTCAIAQHVHKLKDPVCIDAGANFGYFSLLMGMVQGAHIVAIEPNPRLRSLCQRTLTVNGIKNEVVGLALSGTENEEAVLQLPSKHMGSASMIGVGALLEDEELIKLPVKTTTVDSIAEQFEQVDFIKIDCESMEERIWQGMTRTWARNPKMIACMEHTPGSDLVQVLSKEARVQVVEFDGSIQEWKPEYDKQLRMLWVTHQ